MKNLYPVGIQSFDKIRERGYVYIDKTDIIYQLANTNKYYFLYLLLRPISKGRKSCSKDLPWKSWRKTGRNIRCCTLT